ncbi:hypothetical protein H097_06567 [Pseudomonas sp. FH4]|uniref:hypothetical protein n=1 Tax=Pseudomonas fluorescens group TaxID=136843 RepID=UPI0003DC5744|nr:MULTISPECIES: hypothetical protein [Pseudomonas fluorescens group]ETK19798.1 hypothetical protein H097_06567 [Pseudomonas sp. FH4]MBF8005488.1 hypothetical protein [Pseudomonas brenneri]USW97114.1 hypothetical protein NHF39_11590 [Pseudomonas proteolytica]USW98698.1 hypothetical protein NHF41_19770 [Pseudomonas proteolytica]
MSTSGQLSVSRDQVLVAHAAEMIARTGFSQDDFAQALSANLHRQISSKAVSKDVPDFLTLAQGNDTTTFLRASGAWLRRVGRWLSGEVDLPTWVEESWVEALEGDFKDCCINELASRHGLTGARELDGEGNPLGAFGLLVARLGNTVALGSEILADGRIDREDLDKLPEFVDRLRSAEARCSELRSRAEAVLLEQSEKPHVSRAN